MHNPDNAAAQPLEITTSRQFLAWMAEQRLSIALTTYQIGKLFLLGLKDDGDLSVFERTFNRCMGLCPTGNGFYMSSLHQVWRFENMFLQGEQQDGYDRLYVPQVGNTTGDCDIHDMAVDADGRLVFVNTLFGCLATLSETHSFKPLWRPPFLSRLAAEDRCHLNGLALRDGQPAYVTAVSQSDVVDGWRDHRASGGVVVDVQSNEVVAHGLSMPHSPRLHQGKLWLCNSGTGEFGHLDLDSGRFVPVAFCAGYLRGLYFHGDFALVGTSKPRHNKTFSGLPLDAALQSRQAEARCGLQVIDLRTGDAVRRVSVIEGVSEKSGRTGTLVFVRVRHEIHANGAAAPAITEFHDIVYRDAPKPGDAAPPPQAAPPLREGSQGPRTKTTSGRSASRARRATAAAHAWATAPPPRAPRGRRR